jgi:hypothetical protein
VGGDLPADSVWIGDGICNFRDPGGLNHLLYVKRLHPEALEKTPLSNFLDPPAVTTMSWLASRGLNVFRLAFFSSPVMLATPSTPRCEIYKPPVTCKFERPSVFLAGSIERSSSSNWRNDVIYALRHLPVAILNPRQDEWANDWIEDISDERFKQQVDWELLHLDKADIIALYLLPGAISPISLLEMGLHAREGKLVVCCPTGFWKKGNVQVACQRYGIPLVEELDDLKELVKQRLQNLLQRTT